MSTQTQFQLPGLFENHLARTPLEGPVKTALTRFGDLFGDPTRGLPFFPEYTNHGVEHFQRVLDASAWLIADAHQSHFTPEDVSVGAISTLLHDSAMHMTEDGFVTLLKSDNYARVVPDLDKRSWRELWDDYLAEVSRWGDSQFCRILGRLCTETPSQYIEMLQGIIASRSTVGLSRECLMIIGEFIRRHHGRMAHEFAIVGFPGPSDQPPFSTHFRIM